MLLGGHGQLGLGGGFLGLEIGLQAVVVRGADGLGLQLLLGAPEGQFRQVRRGLEGPVLGLFGVVVEGDQILSQVDLGSRHSLHFHHHAGHFEGEIRPVDGAKGAHRG